MVRRFFLSFVILILAFSASVFAQQGAAPVRDFVGLINQTYHPSLVSYFEKAKAELAKQNETDVVRVIDLILKGGFGSGFLFSDENGNIYILTNNHVVAHAHTVSITFEKTDGTKNKFENLRIIATDEENDLVLLAFPASVAPPVNEGLSFLARGVVEGEEVFSAGFPGLGTTPLWQFGNGRISNAFARFPKSIDDDTLMGPFIQHTAQVDNGNSGGPLLIAQENVPSGYAVAGINTLSGTMRQAANFAVPVSVIQSFINNSLNPRPETFRAALDVRLEKFIEALGGSSAAYPRIAELLSTACVGENVEYAFEEMFEKANRSVIRTFLDNCADDFIGAMSIAVAWTIEDSLRSGTAAARVSVKEVTGSGEEYTVVFTINNNDVSSVWMREYGNWRIKSFGAIAAGNRTLVEQRQTQRETSARLRIDSSIHLELGFATLFDKAPAALYAGIDVLGMGFNFYFAGEFWNLGIHYGLNIPIAAGNFGFIPFVRAGVNFSYEKGFFDIESNNFILIPPISFMLQAGLKVTTSYVPGLYLGVNFQYNIFSLMPQKDRMMMGLAFTAGYAF